MKKKNLNLKLQLNKETIANLNNGEMNNIKGGTGYNTCPDRPTCGPDTCKATCFGTCPGDYTCAPCLSAERSACCPTVSCTCTC